MLFVLILWLVSANQTVDETLNSWQEPSRSAASIIVEDQFKSLCQWPKRLRRVLSCGGDSCRTAQATVIGISLFVYVLGGRNCLTN